MTYCDKENGCVVCDRELCDTKPKRYLKNNPANMYEWHCIKCGVTFKYYGPVECFLRPNYCPNCGIPYANTETTPFTKFEDDTAVDKLIDKAESCLSETSKEAIKDAIELADMDNFHKTVRDNSRIMSETWEM